jgi:hypothetical protein
MSLNQIYNANKKRRGRSRYLLSVNVQIRHNNFSESIPAKVVFVRDRNNRKKWIALISTDTTLSEEEIIALYGKRWDIEPFHKMLKSFLRLAAEFQLRSFDAICAHTAIVLTRYIFLAVENRGAKDDRTMGELFFLVCDELHDISFAVAFEYIVCSLFHCLYDILLLAKERASFVVQQFIDRLPIFIMNKLSVGVCES